MWDRPAPPLQPPHIPNNGQGWRYEMRREAQLVVPGLYVGPYQSSTNLGKMKDMGITHVLCIRDKMEKQLIFPRFPAEFTYMTLDISDKSEQNLISIFPACMQFLEGALSSGGTVLAHCNGGIASSPAIVVGYLMYKYEWNFDYALSYIQAKRYCVSPMSIQLKEYEPIHMAQKMIQRQQQGVMGEGEHKRGNGEDEGDEDGYRRKQTKRSAMDMDED